MRGVIFKASALGALRGLTPSRSTTCAAMPFTSRSTNSHDEVISTKRVALDAIRLGGIGGAETVSAFHVLPMIDRLQMPRINAIPLPAQVVQFEPVGNTAPRGHVGDTMGCDALSRFCRLDASIAQAVPLTNPFPTPVFLNYVADGGMAALRVIELDKCTDHRGKYSDTMAGAEPLFGTVAAAKMGLSRASPYRLPGPFGYPPIL